MRTHFVDETQVTLFGRAVIRAPQHEADSPVTQLDEVRRQLASRGIVVDVDRRRRTQILLRRNSHDRDGRILQLG